MQFLALLGLGLGAAAGAPLALLFQGGLSTVTFGGQGRPPPPPLLCGRPAAGAGGALGRLGAARDARWRSRSAFADTLGAPAESQATHKCGQRAFEADQGKHTHAAMVMRDLVLLVLVGLSSAEGRPVRMDRVFSASKRHQAGADFSGLPFNSVKRYVAGFCEYGRIVPGLPGCRGFAK